MDKKNSTGIGLGLVMCCKVTVVAWMLFFAKLAVFIEDWRTGTALSAIPLDPVAFKFLSASKGAL